MSPLFYMSACCQLFIYTEDSKFLTDFKPFASMRYNETNSKWKNRRRYDLAGSLSNGICTILSMFKTVSWDPYPSIMWQSQRAKKLP